MSRFTAITPIASLLPWGLLPAFVLLGSSPVRGQLPAGQGAAPAGAEKPAEPASEHASPRDTLRTFLKTMEQLRSAPDDVGAWEAAFKTLDLPKALGAQRRQVAWHLFGTLLGLGLDADAADFAPDREKVQGDDLTRFALVPAEGEAAAEVKKAVDELGRPPAPVVLEKTATGVWKFSRATLDSVYELFAWIRPRAERLGFTISRYSGAASLQDLIPQKLKATRYVGLHLWQWIGLLAAFFLAVLVDFFGRLILRPAIHRLMRRYVAEPAPDAVRLALRPVGLALGAVVYLALLNLLLLTGMAATILFVAGQIVLIAASVWAAWSLTDLVSNVLLQRARATESAFDDMIIPLVRKSLKLFVIALGLIYLADSLSIELGPLLASFGLAGLAVTFAAQDTVKNLFGGLTIFLDRPFKIGDRVVFRGYDGSIEEIGFRTTKLRTLTGHLVTIPNGLFSAEPVENPARRPTIRRILNVTITYDTPVEKIRQAVEILRGILDEEGIREPIHPVVNGNEMPPRVYFNEFNAASLNIFVIYWFAPPVWWDYNEHAEKLNLRLFEEFEKAGIEFAFPTQTIYLADDPKRRLEVKMAGDGTVAPAAAGRAKAPSRARRTKKSK